MNNNPFYKKDGGQYRAFVKQSAVAAIDGALKSTGGNIAHAAKRLGLTRTYLFRLMRELAIREPRIRLHRQRPSGSYKRQIEQASVQAVIAALTMTKGNRTRAARALGISKTAMERFMRLHKNVVRQFPPQRGGSFR